MAVANWVPWLDEIVYPRNFPPPKRADLKYWYKSAQKALLGTTKLPDWDESFRGVAKVDWDLITFELEGGTLYIVRKRSL